MLRKMIKNKSLIVLLATLVLFTGCLLITPDENKENQFSPSAITLTESIWADGFIATLEKEQWFKFTASAALSYIHFNFGTLNSLYVQLYDSDGNMIGNKAELWGIKPASYSYFTVGQKYYIKATPSFSSDGGTYKIAFNTSPAAPVIVKLPSDAIQLNVDTFADGDITESYEEQWFKFTANADKQYIHVNFGTLSDVHVQLYKVIDKIYGVPAGEETEFSNAIYRPKYTSRELNAGEEYYIKVTPHHYYYHNKGTYQIAFSTLFISPVFDIKPLTANNWADGDFTKTDEVHWYKFTATAATQYIHASFDTMNDWSGVLIQLYDGDGKMVGEEGKLREDPFDPNGKYTNRTLEVGKTYFIKVYLYTYLHLGTYKITFNTSKTLPPVTLPPNATMLLPIYYWFNNNWYSWYNTSLTAGNAQWFNFVAAYAYEQFIHINFDTLNSDGVYVQLLDGNGYILSESTQLRGIKSYTIPLPVYPGQPYYIKILSTSNSGTFKIAFSIFETPPPLP